ncbi:MAG: hypothetical protein HWE27_09845 [Gammaproteobacteria bacterium]|nr:hypothetical protein [Gammaproteobacteria bacterium]
MVTPSTEISLELANKIVGALTRTTLGVGARQDFTNNFGAYIRYEADDFGGDTAGIGLSAKF